VAARPAWLRRLPDAIAQLEALPRDQITRVDLQTLLGLKKRRAVQLMHECGAARMFGSHGALVVGRGPLIKRLKALRRGRAYLEESARLERVVTVLSEARVARIRVRVDPAVLSIRLAGLPDGVLVEPGRIEVQYGDARGAVAKLYALSQALLNDWERFERLVEQSRRARGE
jgi:hypothetical protein